MLRLTVRSSRDGRFLARAVHRRGRTFVLDFGDSRLIGDLTERIGRGFTAIRDGTLHIIAPDDTRLLARLAEHYLREGLVVDYEEPAWPHRDAPPNTDTA